ncbi:hypothetical protein [Homoserinibacter sp. GY 40078]|uniref:hypothetical protein n=1 Tax=Homoserinibacter sp. GY 40078 TaxID=2603275 RepID=UPI0011C6EE02|nr:hypothetical protein [Homoserinibacter sp. GY 40078]TXK17527.1 hypothetical protein FVQ89_11960 [Homoserinibacter sp. GY 40078]
MPPFPFVELPYPERQAMRLDGELYAVGEVLVPVGVPDTPELRAGVALRGRSSRLIAARRTAAWVWGAVSTPPRPAEFIADLDARWRSIADGTSAVVESVVRPGDAVRLGGARVTSPLRTALDLARFPEVFGRDDAEIVRRLAEVGGFDAEAASRALDRTRNLAGKHRALDRIRDALSRS